MPGESHLLYALIVACEVGFWVILLLALAVRYVRRWSSPEKVERWGAEVMWV